MRAGMRREDDVRQILERRIDERLLLKGVQTQTAKLAGADGLGCSCFVDQTAACGVDDDRAILHLRDPGRVDHVTGRIIQRHVQGNDVRCAQQIVQLHALDAMLGREGLVKIRVVGHDIHLERLGTHRQTLADRAHADDAERLAGQLHALAARPFAVGDCLVQLRDIPRRGEHQGKCQLTDGGRVCARGVRDRDAAGLGSRQIHAVDADTVAGDHLDALWHFLDDVRCDIVDARDIRVAALQTGEDLVALQRHAKLVV